MTDVKALSTILAGGKFSLRASVGKVPFPGKLGAIPRGVSGGRGCECDGKGREGGEQPLRLRPGPEHPAGPAWGGVSSGRAGREVPRRHRGTGPAVRPPSTQAMASAARGSGPWPPLLLQLAALLGTLRPQVRSGRPRSLQARVGGAGVRGCGGATGGASPSPGSGWPQVSPWPEKTSSSGGVASCPTSCRGDPAPRPSCGVGVWVQETARGTGPSLSCRAS